jgi:glycosyltransferase involved in cell wall biosynthesis
MAPRKVSAVFSVYNGAATLAQMLDSLLAQSRPPDEVLAVDDASSDETLQILQRYARRYKTLRVLRNERNLGLASSLNRAIEAASGEYIMRTDADDLNLSDRLEQQMRAMEADPQLGLVSCFVDPLFDPSYPAAWRPLCQLSEQRRRKLAAHPQDIPNQLKTGFVFHHGEVLFKKQVWEQAGKYRPVFLCCEDYDLWLRMADLTSFAILPQTLYIRRFHSGSLSARYLALQQLGVRLAREGYQRRQRGEDDLPYVREAFARYLQTHKLEQHFAYFHTLQESTV